MNVMAILEPSFQRNIKHTHKLERSCKQLSHCHSPVFFDKRNTLVDLVTPDIRLLIKVHPEPHSSPHQPKDNGHLVMRVSAVY